MIFRCLLLLLEIAYVLARTGARDTFSFLFLPRDISTDLDIGESMALALALAQVILQINGAGILRDQFKKGNWRYL